MATLLTDNSSSVTSNTLESDYSSTSTDFRHAGCSALAGLARQVRTVYPGLQRGLSHDRRWQLRKQKQRAKCGFHWIGVVCESRQLTVEPQVSDPPGGDLEAGDLPT